MKQLLCWGIVGGFLLSAGCAHITGGRGNEGKEVFASMQAAVSDAASAVAPSVVLVNIDGSKGSGRGLSLSYSGGSMHRYSGGGSRTSTGIILDSTGNILVPNVYDPESAGRITVWVGDSEYHAKVVKADNLLEMTIMRINPEEELVPLSRDNLADLSTGSWCVTVTPSDEDKDFEKYTSLGVCRGEIDGRYRVFDIDGFSRIQSGAVVVDMNGRPIGIIKNRKVLSIRDLNDDLQALLDDAGGVTSPDDEARKKGRLGIMLHPINKDYAKEHDLPRSSLWITHVIANSPAEAAGIQRNDLITALNGKPLRLSGSRARDYFMKSLRPKVDEKFEIGVMRDGKEVICKGVFDKTPEEEKMFAKDIGVEVKAITDTDIIYRNLFTTEGVIVTKVDGGSPAATSSSFGQGLLGNGDVITAIGGHPTPTLEEFARVLDDLRRDNPDVLLIEYRRGMVTGYAGLNLRIGENGKGDI